MKISVLFALLAAAVAAPSFQPDFLQALEHKGTATVIISFKNSRLSEVREAVASQRYANRTARLNGLYNALKAHANETQANVLALLTQFQTMSSTKIQVRQLWITNQIIVRGADAELFKQLLTMDEISEIQEDRIFPLEKPIKSIIHPEGYVPNAGEQWGVSKIDAPSVWSTGVRGQGVIVANIDTGVRGTHEALRTNYRSAYGWYDPYGDYPNAPSDPNGHGTHTMGILAGTLYGIGVAPGAQWIACRGCGSSTCGESELLECGQWILCPTLPNGQSPNCSMAPDVCSNSWAGGSSDPWYNDVILAWTAAGIAPVFGIGNAGPECGSVNSPADSVYAIGVGATTVTDTLSSFSSVGPTTEGRRIKPDIAAPGSGVFSAFKDSDTSYATLSGTSMATPHAAGAAALLRGANPNISVYDIRKALLAGAQPTSPTGRNCGGINESIYPNNHVGAGRVSVTASIAAVKNLDRED